MYKTIISYAVMMLHIHSHRNRRTLALFSLGCYFLKHKVLKSNFVPQTYNVI